MINIIIAFGVLMILLIMSISFGTIFIGQFCLKGKGM